MTCGKTNRALLALALLLGLAAEPALAQRGRGQGTQKPGAKAQPGPMRPGMRERMQQREERQASRPENQQQENEQGQSSERGPGQGFRPGKGGEGPGPMGRGPFERLRQMSPEEQERFLQNNPRFQRMSPEDQERFRARLQEWNSLTPEAKRERLRRESVLEGLSPQERRHFHQEVIPRWQQLPPQRKFGIVRRLNALRGLSDEERDRRLNDPAFMQDLNGEEQDILRTFARLRMWPPEPGRGPQGPAADRPPLL